MLRVHDFRPGVLVFLRQQHAPLSASHIAQARAAATKMTYAVLSLRAALFDRTPIETVLNIVSLAFSYRVRTLCSTLQTVVLCKS